MDFFKSALIFKSNILFLLLRELYSNPSMTLFPISFVGNILKFLFLPKFIVGFITKNLDAKSNIHYDRLNKLFISNFIKPNKLIDKNYKYLYNLKSSLSEWKKINSSDWD